MSLGAQLVALIGSAHALPTRSGSAAIVAALNCAELSPHAEVIMPAICCPAVFSSIAFAGFTPRLADVDLSDLCSGPAEIEAQISPRTAAIIAVHSYGRRCAIEEISSLAKDRGLLLIEDACLALGGGSEAMVIFRSSALATTRSSIRAAVAPCSAMTTGSIEGHANC